MHQLGYFGIALLMFLDNVFPPIPSEVIMPSAGYAASQGQLSLWGVIIAGSVGSLSAAASLYWLGARFKTQTILAFVTRYGRFFFVKTADVEKSLAWFERYGYRVVFFGRMVPAVRSMISIPAGMSGMPFGYFMLYSGLGTLIWTSFLAVVGYYLGENQQQMQHFFSQVSHLILIIVASLIIWIFYRRWQRKRKQQT